MVPGVEEAHAGGRLLHRHCDEVGRDVGDEDVVQVATRWPPVRLGVRVGGHVAEAGPAVAGERGCVPFRFAAAAAAIAAAATAALRVAGAHLVHAPEFPLLVSPATRAASANPVLSHPLVASTPRGQSRALRSAGRLSVFCSFDNDATAAPQRRSGCRLDAATRRPARTLEVKRPQAERLVGSVPGRRH